MGLAFIIIGVDFLTWGSETAPLAMQCTNCGMIQHFVVKKGMRFVTIFFVIPVFPVSGVKKLLECPNCKTRYQQDT
ncbi:MAG TPA: zinc-ribbon domain-containing protein [Pyrinomonadaceae bacterium]|jgi:hypothetical protein